MSENVVKIETWDSHEGEQAMQEGHEPSWRAMISHIEEDSLEGKSVLDFGCNRGGFLRLLYQTLPYKEALGVDIAQDSLANARENSAGIPAVFAHNDVLKEKSGQFDFAFSHEVVYLLPDLQAHAKEISNALKPGGVYYMAIGEYAENPIWERWKKTVAEFSPVPPQTYSLQDMACAFQDNGFSVAVRKLVCDGFFPYDATDGKYLQSPLELIRFMTEQMVLFRFRKL